jgi:GNAT superfamily N-acetyltransferase
MTETVQPSLDLIPVFQAEVLQLHGLAHAVYTQHYKDLWVDEGKTYLDRSFSIEQLSKELDDDLVRYFFVRSDFEPVGFLKLVLPLNANNSKGLYLERLYLGAAHTGKGLGTQSLLFVDNFAKLAGLERVWLQAMAYRNDVCAFYLRHGYVLYGENRLSHSGVVPGREKMLIMEKSISVDRVSPPLPHLTKV